MSKIQYILFDAANTLIHKPEIWVRIKKVLENYHLNVSTESLQYHHKIISEVLEFPDRTSKEFYRKFNSELLLSLGILPNNSLLDEIFNECSYLPWEKFDDTEWLSKTKIPIGVLSNFKNTLQSTLENLYGPIFSNFIVSEIVNIRKPQIEFYQHAVDELRISPREILYVGDSLKLDIIPAQQIGMNALLIDRSNVFKSCKFAIDSLNKIESYFSL